MQSLKDYLNESPLHCEGILDPDQNKVMSRMADVTDEMIRNRIREYCTYDRLKYDPDEQWIVAGPNVEIVKIDKDKKGWYIETKSASEIIMHSDIAKSFYDYCSSCGQKIDKQKGFLIEDIGVYFRWRKHKGLLFVIGNSDFESTDGLPEKLSGLIIASSCQKSGKFTIHNEINCIGLDVVDNLNMTGKGCKNVVIYPNNNNSDITPPRGAQVYHPQDRDTIHLLIKKLAEC